MSSKTQKLCLYKLLLREQGITINWSSEWQEYRVNFINGKEPTAYYTNDIQDAYGTGLAMALELKGILKSQNGW